MQINIGNLIREFVNKQEENFIEMQGGSFIHAGTGEFFTKVEHDKYIKLKLEDYKIEIMAETNSIAKNEFGIENEQHLVNARSQKKRKTSKTRETYDGGDFNMVYRNKVQEVVSMKLNNNEKLTYYILREFVQYPTNCIILNDHIPSIKELEPIIGLTERSIITVLNSLEDKGLIKRKQCGHKKAIYINPEYYASGKDLDIDTLSMFGLFECDDNKIKDYL